MNDRYLYRAKRIDNGEWVEGYIVIYPSGRFDIHKKCMEPPDALAVYEVDQSAICQCTGLNDKNGKLIWENDVVKHDFGKDQIGVQLAIVKYDSKYACYQIKPIFDWMYCDKSDCEVIGNIFDNPELLEVG